jgi:hypothetical protein
MLHGPLSNNYDHLDQPYHGTISSIVPAGES